MREMNSSILFILSKSFLSSCSQEFDQQPRELGTDALLFVLEVHEHIAQSAVFSRITAPHFSMSAG